jgi:peroxiredoxin
MSWARCAGAAAAIGVVWCATVGLAAAAHASEPRRLPHQLVDLTGAPVDLAALATNQRLFFVTLKATWCPVCQVQLQRLHRQLARLRACGATFVVLAPGPRSELTRIAEQTGFPYPFVEDVDLAIARVAGLLLAADQIEPAIFEVNAQREIVWIDRGRNAGHFNDEALLARLECTLHTAGVVAFAHVCAA